MAWLLVLIVEVGYALQFQRQAWFSWIAALIRVETPEEICQGLNLCA